jgi:hypothetical protein
VQRLAGADHGDAAARAIAKRSHYRAIYVRDLDPLDPCRPLAHECVVEASQRLELLPLFDLGRDDRHEVKSLLPGRTHLLQASERPPPLQAPACRRAQLLIA